MRKTQAWFKSGRTQPHAPLDSQPLEMPTSAAPRGDDLDGDYVNEEYDRRQPVGAQNNADTMP